MTVRSYLFGKKELCSAIGDVSPTRPQRRSEKSLPVTKKSADNPGRSTVRAPEVLLKRAGVSSEELAKAFQPALPDYPADQSTIARIYSFAHGLGWFRRIARGRPIYIPRIFDYM